MFVNTNTNISSYQYDNIFPKINKFNNKKYSNDKIMCVILKIN